jgi:hypothetical protein
MAGASRSGSAFWGTLDAAETNSNVVDMRAFDPDRTLTGPRVERRRSRNLLAPCRCIDHPVGDRQQVRWQFDAERVLKLTDAVADESAFLHVFAGIRVFIILCSTRTGFRSRIA